MQALSPPASPKRDGSPSSSNSSHNDEDQTRCVFKYILFHINISLTYLTISKIILYISFYSPPPKKTGRFEFSQNNHYLSDDYSDDEEEHLHSK